MGSRQPVTTLLASLGRMARFVEGSAQEVLDVLQPGPYNSPARWTAESREAAAEEVRRAVAEWERRQSLRQQRPGPA
ncbi:hypothetical protein ACKKBF_B32110 [Auxenochlorella protothecoides x Auxenochlorella symbiontica]